LKGPAGFDELKQSAPAVKALGLDLVRTKQLKSEEGGRINFYFRKLKKTPSKYPRNFGQMKKKPLEETEWEKS
jgi:16S rRNA (guanine527-N7)-methyltransferase